MFVKLLKELTMCSCILYIGSKEIQRANTYFFNELVCMGVCLCVCVCVWVCMYGCARVCMCVCVTNKKQKKTSAFSMTIYLTEIIFTEIKTVTNTNITKRCTELHRSLDSTMVANALKSWKNSQWKHQFWCFPSFDMISTFNRGKRKTSKWWANKLFMYVDMLSHSLESFQ